MSCSISSQLSTGDNEYRASQAVSDTNWLNRSRVNFSGKADAGLLLCFTYPVHASTTDRARPFRRWPTVLHGHLHWVADLSLGLALYTIRFHGCLLGLIWAHPSEVRLGTQD